MPERRSRGRGAAGSLTFVFARCAKPGRGADARTGRLTYADGSAHYGRAGQCRRPDR